MAQFEVELLALHWLPTHCSIIVCLYIYLFIFINILPCYFPDPPVRTVDVRFTFPREYKPVYDNLDADETKEFTTQIVNAVSLIFVHIFIS